MDLGPDRLQQLAIDRRTLLGAALGLSALGLLPALSGCSAPAPATIDPVTTGLQPLTVTQARVPVQAGDASALGEVAEGMRAFAARLHAATAATSENWTVSPLSIAVAFGMLRAGAAGTTATQLDDAFGWPGDDRTHEALNALTADLVTTDAVDRGPAAPSDGRAPDPIVAVANGLFLDRGFAPRVREEFLRVLAAQYGAEATGVSFADPSAAATINAWVAQQTRGRIDRLFDQLDPSTALVLANAVYLKATWREQFTRATTTDAVFTGPAGPVTAPLMRSRLDRATYDETAERQRIRLPYVGGELAMHVVVPRAVVTDVDALSALLPAALTSPAGHAMVDLTLPRWDTATTLPLLPALAAVGVTDVGDLTGIAPGDLAVSDAVHRANVTVDEDGTEAAAVTGIAVGTSAVAGTPVTMTADRPFVWAVVHQPTGTPVFAGHVVDPTR